MCKKQTKGLNTRIKQIKGSNTRIKQTNRLVKIILAPYMIYMICVEVEDESILNKVDTSLI